ncbi:MAG: protein translocase subunit SecD [Terrimicrobiaceae bacterium]
MSPAFTFFFGLVILALFGWYFATELANRKRWLGLVLTILLTAFCIEQVWPPTDVKNAEGQVVVPGKIRLGLDLQGGTSFLIRLIPQTDSGITKDLLDQAVEVIRKRVDQFGVSEPVISPQGKDQILVQIAGLDTKQIEDARAQLQKVAKLEFAMVDPGGEARVARVQAGEEVMPPAYILKPYKLKKDSKEATQILITRRPALTGEHVARAFPFFDQQGYGVSLELDAEGAKIFDEVAVQHKGHQMAILLDGEVLSAPVLQSDHYFGRAQITGHFTDKEARELASALENPLRVPVQIEETRSVSPTLGEDSVRSGVVAGLVGLALVILFVLLYYRFAGLVAIFGLLINIVILFGTMAMFHFTLTLPGIAGIILTIGMAVDANVLIYERLREEMAAGKSLAAGLNGAYDKAFSAIFDANATTLITAVILFWQATGSVKGFAVTLTLGIIASMFSALLITRTAFRWMIDKGVLKNLTMLDLIPKKKFDFLGKRWVAAVFSLLLIGGSAGIFALRGEGNFGIDFRGGDLLIVDSAQPVSVAEARKAVDDPAVVIQFERAGMKDLLSFRSAQGSSKEIVGKLKAAFPDRGISVIGQDTVGAQIGMEFARRAIWALGLGMVGILIYVTLRFEFSFALGALVALLHDVIITLGIFSLIGGELSLVMVGAILTIAGYSINDTIVVFDRIREGLKQGERGSIQTLMNNSINETLGRTILTGGSTLLSVGALYFFGGAVLRDFSFAILVGIGIGTYSSVFIAAPIVLWASKLRGKSVRREVLESEALRQP